MVAKLKLSQSNKEAVVAGLLKIGGSMLLKEERPGSSFWGLS
jgi:hypothetical protein